MHTTSLRTLRDYRRARRTGIPIRTTVPQTVQPTLRPRFSMKELRAA